MLRDDGLLRRWEGPVCPHCERGTLGKLAPHRGVRKHRCNAKKCQKYISPHHAHPLFVESTGNSHTPLATQSALLMLILNRAPNAAIHHLLHINHKSIEDFAKRLGQLTEAWVVDTEKSICFGKDRLGRHRGRRSYL